MAITVNLRYTGKNGNARRFAEEMTAGGTVAAIRSEKGNLRYEYYQPLEDPYSILRTAILTGLFTLTSYLT